MSELNISEVSTDHLATLQGQEAILLAFPGIPARLVFEEGTTLILDIELAYYTGNTEGGIEFQGFDFSEAVSLSGDLRMTIDVNGSYIIAFVCNPFTKDEGSDVILLRQAGGEIVFGGGEVDE